MIFLMASTIAIYSASMVESHNLLQPPLLGDGPPYKGHHIPRLVESTSADILESVNPSSMSLHEPYLRETLEVPLRYMNTQFTID